MDDGWEDSNTWLVEIAFLYASHYIWDNIPSCLISILSFNISRSIDGGRVIDKTRCIG